jgi:AraC-like DNA-binding protein
MIFQEISPAPNLQSLVKNYLLINLWDGSRALPVKPYPTRIEQALVFFARGYIDCYDPITKTHTKIPRNALFGQQISRLDFLPIENEDFLMFMVIFHTGAMHRLLRFSSDEVTCQFCDAEAIMNSELQHVNDQLANCKNYPAMITCIDNFLTKKMNRIQIDQHPIDAIGNLLLANPTAFSLDWLARQANMSPRQFQRKFHERIGLSPKLYSRISRFWKAFEYKEKNPSSDWLSIALQFGYSDYYHLSKDFKQFAHVTPNILIEEYSKRPEVVFSKFLDKL